jgi:hypothetical protein
MAVACLFRPYNRRLHLQLATGVVFSLSYTYLDQIQYWRKSNFYSFTQPLFLDLATFLKPQAMNGNNFKVSTLRVLALIQTTVKCNVSCNIYYLSVSSHNLLDSRNNRKARHLLSESKWCSRRATTEVTNGTGSWRSGQQNRCALCR